MKRYVATHWHWDDDDNEYVLEAIWVHERNYPEMPDQWVLCELELVEPVGVTLDVKENSPVWSAIEREGPPDYSKMSEEDYI